MSDGKKGVKKRPRVPDRVQECAGEVTINPERQAGRFEWVCMGVLLALGLYLGYAYFGQKAVPNSDFTAFVETGGSLLHFQLPGSFKRVPVLGILQIAVSRLMFTSPCPILSGALVLNGVLYILSLVLFYKICRFFFEQTASLCVSLIAALNPWALVMVVDPIAETAIVFFLLLTLYLILRRSWWCYLAAMLGSMTRYECFLLIGIALLFDLFGRKSKREKGTAIGLALAAAIPMLLWMIGTKLTNTDPNSHYFKHFLNVEHRNGFNLLKMLWQTTFSPLLQRPEWIRAVLIEKPTSPQTAQVIQSHNQSFQSLWNIVTAVFFGLGVIGVFLKKEWKFACILLFWLPYVSVHMSQSVLIDRYTLPAVWLTLLIAAYGLIHSVGWCAGRVPKGVLYIAMGLGAMLAAVWAIQLWPAVPATAAVSPASANAAYAALLLTVTGLIAKQILFRRKTIAFDVCLFCVMAMVIVSNQFMLSFRLGRGDLDIEFRKTAEWYLAHAKDGERLATTLPGVVNLFLPVGRQNAIHTGGIPGKTFEEFIQSCKQQNIRYVAWDSRLGVAVNDEYYRGWGLKKTAPLASGQDIGPFKFITRITANPQRYINLYRLETD
jgi:hypothetical protein